MKLKRLRRTAKVQPMTCEICKQKLKSGNDDFHLNAVPMKRLCLGCFVFSVEMDKFLIRSGQDLGIMGAWTEGWMREILKNPKKHL